jgi:hypothetical protein
MAQLPEDEIVLAILPSLLQSSAVPVAETLNIVRRAYDIADLVLSVRAEREKSRQIKQTPKIEPEERKIFYSKPFGLK